jgi:multiple sugar transport system substrate-binding protein
VTAHARWYRASSQRRSALALLSALGGLIALAGCGNGSSSSSPVTTITELGAPTGLSAPFNQAQFQTCGKQAGVTVRLEQLDKNTGLQKVIQEASIGHGTPADAIVNTDIANLQEVASTGALVPLKNFGFTAKDYFPGVRSSVSYKGQVYGMTEGVNTIALFYNKAMFAAAGIQQPPVTWDELIADAKKLTNGSVKGIAFTANPTEEGTWQFEPFVWSNGGSLLHLNSQSAIQALQVWNTLVSSGAASKSVVSWSQADIAQQFIAGDAAMVINGPWNLPIITKAPFDFGIAPIPVPHAGDQVVVPFGGGAWGITKQSNAAVEQKAYQVLACVNSTNNVLTWAKNVYYVPPTPANAAKAANNYPQMQIFNAEIPKAKSRADEGGLKYSRVSAVTATSIEAALTGGQSPQAAFTSGQQQIDQIMSGG